MSRHSLKHHPWRFEGKHERLAPFSIFAKRVASSFVIAFALVSFALWIGIIGYHSLAGFAWVDSLLEASMLLGGMGPVNPPVTLAGKLFAGCYALYAGLLFIVTAGLLFTPVLHRLMHRFHWTQ